MSGRTKSAVRSVMLRWARETSGCPFAEVADRMGVSPAIIRSWEDDQSEERPSIAQAKRLAALYGRSLALLYLPEPPVEPAMPADYRMGLTGDRREVSPALRKVIRRMRDLRDSALDLADDLDETADRFPVIPIRSSLDQPAADLAGPVRRWLGIEMESQAQWRDPKHAFTTWRESLEAHGVIVFVELGAHSLPVTEVRGFCIAEDQSPVILVNNHDAKTAQIFTLFHEVGHILLREPALCLEMDQDESNGNHASKVEAWCNRFAGEMLVPSATLKGHPLTSLVADQLRRDPTVEVEGLDADLREIATYFSVSAEVIIRRLAVIGRLSTQHYLAWRGPWYSRHPIHSDSPISEKKRGGPSPAQLAPTRFGMHFLSLVYSAYWSDARSALEVGDLLGGRMTTVKQTETIVRRSLKNVAHA